MQKNGLDIYFPTYTKIKSKWIKDLNVRLQTMKLLENNIRELLQGISLKKKSFLDRTLKVQATEAKIDK
jgi:hypothetical protein